MGTPSPHAAWAPLQRCHWPATRPPWGRPARTRRRPHRWTRPWGRAGRRRFGRGRHGRPSRSRRCPARHGRPAHSGCIGCRPTGSPSWPGGWCQPALLGAGRSGCGTRRGPRTSGRVRCRGARALGPRAWAVRRRAAIRAPGAGRVAPVAWRCAPPCPAAPCGSTKRSRSARPAPPPRRRGSCPGRAGRVHHGRGRGTGGEWWCPARVRPATAFGLPAR